MDDAAAGQRQTITSSPPAKRTASAIPDLAFQHAGLEWEKYVEIDPKYYRPAEVDLLIGDAAKARKQLGWSPKTSFAELVRIMTDADIAMLANEMSGKNIRE